MNRACPISNGRHCAVSYIFRLQFAITLNIIFRNTAKPGDGRLDSKLQGLVNFLLPTKISNHRINHKIDRKSLAIVNIYALLSNFTRASFDCTYLILGIVHFFLDMLFIERYSKELAF